MLDRPRENRSQLVFTRIQGGREGIFWQIRAHHPPSPPRDPRPPPPRRRPRADLTILVDTRERYPYKFAHQQASTERRALPAGDYGIAHDEQIVAVVERKSLHDLVRRLIDGQLTYALADMATVPRAAVVIEDRYSNLFKLEHTKPGFVTEMLAALTVRYPTVPIHFAETRPLAEEWTYRFLGAALAYAPSRKVSGTSDGSSLVLTDPDATLRAHPIDRRRECQAPDATSSAHAAQIARSNAAADNHADRARTISRAAYLAHQARAAARQLRGLDDDELRDLFDELFELPQLDLALTITLPQLITPDLQHLFDAVKADDPDAGDEVIPAILARLDTPVERARLARAIINLRDTRRLDSLLAAAAIIDLDSRSRILLNASLIQAAFIHTGVARTPGGLRLAA